MRDRSTIGIFRWAFDAFLGIAFALLFVDQIWGASLPSQLTASVHSWDDTVWHLLAVLVPVLAIFGSTPLLVPQRPVVQQCGHEEEVGPWQKMSESTSGTHGPCLHQICQVVGMSGNTPPPRCKQETLMLFTVACGVLASNELCWLAPKLALSLSSTNIVPLEVGRAEDGVPGEPEGQESNRLRSAQIGRISGEVLDLEGVEAWQECCITPSQHESEMVVANVDCSGVPIFIVEEVHDIDHMEHGHDDHRRSDVAELLVLEGSPREVARMS